MVDDALQVRYDFLLRLSCELCHIRQIHTGFLPDGECQRFTRCFHIIDLSVGLYRPFREHIRLAFEVPLVVKHLKGA